MTEEKKYTFGLDKKTACTLTYVVGWVSGLVFFLNEKEDKEIRFNAMQSIIFFGALTVLIMIPVIGWALSPFLFLIGLTGWIFLVVKTYQGGKLKLPVVGDIAEKQVNK